MIPKNNERLKALEAEKDSLRFSLKRFEETDLKLESEVARLKAELSDKKGNLIQERQGWNKTVFALEARLTEAVRVLEETGKDIDRCISNATKDRVRDDGLEEMVFKIKSFLQSPTNSEAKDEINEAREILKILGFCDWPKDKELKEYLERQMAKDKVIEAARILFGKHGIDRADFYRESGNSAKGNLADAIKALDSLPSNKCEHDFDTVWIFEFAPNCEQIKSKDESKLCPFCDKKTGGV